MKTLCLNTSIKGIDTKKAQRGWVCEIYFGVETHQQSTYEYHTVRGYGVEHWLGVFGLITAICNTVILCSLYSYRLQKIAGKYNNDQNRNFITEFYLSILDKKHGDISYETND